MSEFLFNKLSDLKARNLEALAQLFSCMYCEI